MRFVLLLLLALSAPQLARAAGVCQGHATDDTLRPMPAMLAPQAARAFGLEAMPVAQLRRSTMVRCMDGQVWACNAGANLPCGKADMSRSLPAAKEWCQANPAADYVPAYISGHGSAYAWRCQGGVPVRGQAARLDARGFFAAYWRKLQG
jgi:hypothetical protein